MATTANVTSSEDGLLLLDARQRSLVPLNPAAFGVGQDSERRLNEAYRDCLLVGRDGSVQRIASIEVLGAYGDSLLKRLFHGAFGSRAIRTELTQASLSLDEFRSRVKEYLEADLERGDTNVPTEQVEELRSVIEAVEQADSFAAIFDAIRFPPLADCLDVL